VFFGNTLQSKCFSEHGVCGEAPGWGGGKGKGVVGWGVTLTSIPSRVHGRQSLNVGAGSIRKSWKKGDILLVILLVDSQTGHDPTFSVQSLTAS